MLTEFLKLVEADAARQNVKLFLSPDPYVYTLKDAARCRGYFGEDEEILAVGVGFSEWPAILAHEFGHLEQAAEGLFQSDSLGFEPYSLLEAFYAGKKVPEKKLDKAFEFVMACELDAERRAVGYISRYQLASDLGAYIAKANGYIVSHLWAKKHQQWPHGTVDWPKLAEQKLLPNNRIWAREEVILSPELEKAIDDAQGR